jgi:hypothetical protein
MQPIEILRLDMLHHSPAIQEITFQAPGNTSWNYGVLIMCRRSP